MLSLHNNTSQLSISNQLSRTQKTLQTSYERLSSGYRINSAKDDAAGLAIANNKEAQIRGMTVASRNVNDGISLLQTAEGSFSSATDILQKMRELAVSASQGTLSDDDRANMDKDYQELAKAFEENFKNVSYNGKKILGDDAGAFVLQVGANAGDTFTITTTAGKDLLGTHGDLTDMTNAGTALAAMDTALKAVSGKRTEYAAQMSRLDYTFDNLQTSITNTTDARSRIVDADVALEVSKMTSAQIAQQAGTAMLSQANQNQSLILSLLR